MASLFASGFFTTIIAIGAKLTCWEVVVLFIALFLFFSLFEFIDTLQ